MRKLSNIKNALASLSESDYEKLMLAFNKGLTCSVEVRQDIYIATYFEEIPNFEVIEQKGCWALGRYTNARTIDQRHFE